MRRALWGQEERSLTRNADTLEGTLELIRSNATVPETAAAHTVQDDRDTARADLNARFERVVGYIAEGNARRRHLQQKMKTKTNKKATRDVMR
jgi:hypothetical protein